MKKTCNTKKTFFVTSTILRFKHLFTLLIAVTCSTAHAQSWINVGSAGLSDSAASFINIAVDKSGTPYIVYEDAADSFKAIVKKYNGSSWVTVGSEGFSAGAAAYTSIAIGPDGTPYVVFSDGDNSWGTTVMKYNGSSWVAVGIVNFSAGIAAYTSIAIDTSGTPYVVYMDGCCLDLACNVMKYNGSSWVAVGSSFTSNAVNGLSMALSPSGTPYVAYEDGENSAASALEYNSGGWSTVGVTEFTHTWSISVSIAIDGNGTPYVASSDIGDNGNASVMKYNGSSWVNVGSADFSPGLSDYTTIAIDPSGMPYVFYSDADTSTVGEGPATVMKFDGSNWVTVGSRGFSAGNINSTSIAIDSNGTPYVAYQDAANKNKATVMKYGVDEAVKIINQPVSSITIYPNPNQGSFTLNISAPINEDVQVIITNIVGEKIKELTTATNQETSLKLDIMPGIYFLSAVIAEEHVNAKIVVE